MRRPLRQFYFHLAKELGKTISEIEALDSQEISEWMAYYMTQDEEWQKKYEADKINKNDATRFNAIKGLILTGG
jgi:hypothetical protein